MAKRRGYTRRAPVAQHQPNIGSHTEKTNIDRSPCSMRQFARPLLASLIVLAYAGTAHAGSYSVDNLTLFSATAATSPDDVLRQNAERFGLPASLNNLTLVKVQESITGKHYHYQQMLRGLPVDRAEIIVS